MTLRLRLPRPIPWEPLVGGAPVAGLVIGGLPSRVGAATAGRLIGWAKSLAAMGAAGLGLLPPVEGAVHEGIDVAVILNAFRARRAAPR